MNKRHRHPIARTLSEFTEFPIEAMCTIPIVTLKGNEEAEITCCRGILEYDDGRVVVATSGDTVTVTGKGLILSGFHNGSLRIHGVLCAVNYGAHRETEEKGV